MPTSTTHNGTTASAVYTGQLGIACETPSVTQLKLHQMDLHQSEMVSTQTKEIF